MSTRVLIANLPPDATAEEVREELVHVGAPVLKVEMVPKTSEEHRSAIAEIDIEWTIAKIMASQPKLRQFKGRTLRVSVLTEAH